MGEFNKKEYMKNWYIQNKDKKLEHYLEKVKCECGCMVARNAIYKHKKSNKHKNMLNYNI